MKPKSLFFNPSFERKLEVRLWDLAVYVSYKTEPWDDKYLFILTVLSHVCVQAVRLFETKTRFCIHKTQEQDKKNLVYRVL